MVQSDGLNRSGLLAGKRGLVMGVANERSLAWAIAKAASDAGAELMFSYQGEALQKRVEPLAAQVNSKSLLQCDVSSEESLEACAKAITAQCDGLDFIVHSIGFSDKNELQGRFVDTSKANFLNTMDISCFSFVSVAKHFERLLKPGASLLTLSYYGAEKVIPNYNVMGVAKAALECSVRYMANDLGKDGIRVNAISAGPIKTLAAAGISGMRDFLRISENFSPLKRNTDQQDVANAAMFLLSGLGSGVTGEVLYVDCGYNIMGMCFSPVGE